MAKISTYPIDSTVNGLDILIGSDADDSSITKNYSINSIKAYSLSGLGVAITSVLVAQSNVNQLPSGTNNPLQVTFGAAQGTPSDPVQLLATGEIVFNQGGQYLFNGYANFEREGNQGGNTVTVFRALLNGVQVTPTKAVELDKINVMIPYELTIPIYVNAGDVLTWEIMRDSSGVDGGGLYTHTVSGGWTNVPSADLNIFKIGI